MANWTVADIPSQRGRNAIVTGTGGLGLEDAIALSRAGAAVIIAGRNATKGAAAVARVREMAPGADVRFEAVDLASMASVTDFGQRLNATLPRLDLLINNAAVMAPPARQETADGFELQLATNYLGHFALTGHLLPLLKQGQEARVVSLSSVASRDGAINFDDLQATGSYQAMTVYSQSKLACLMFAIELQRRSEAGHWGIASMAAHPGISNTELIPNGRGSASPAGMIRTLFGSVLFQAPAQGALPTLFAATSPTACPGAYYGPNRLNEVRGYPAPAKIPAQAKDAAVAARLWDISEQLTGVTFA